MTDLELRRHSECAIVRADGPLDAGRAAEALIEAIEFVPRDEHLILDLGDVTDVGAACARSIATAITARLEWAETAIVSRSPAITMQLVLHDVDRIAPVVRSVSDAAAVIRSRTGSLVADTWV